MKKTSGWALVAVVAMAVMAGSARASIGSATTRCQAAELYLESRGDDGRPRGYAYVRLYKAAALGSETPFSVNTYPHPDFPSNPIPVDGLTVKVLSATLIDTTSDTSDGGLGTYRHTHAVYAVKLHLEANEPIDLAVHGDIGGNVKQTDKYTICTETTSEPVH